MAVADHLDELLATDDRQPYHRESRYQCQRNDNDKQPPIVAAYYCADNGVAGVLTDPMTIVNDVP